MCAVVNFIVRLNSKYGEIGDILVVVWGTITTRK